MQKTVDIQEEHRQLSRGLTGKVLDRAASDHRWKQQFLDDQQAAMREANFPEAQRLEEMSQQQEDAEVAGHSVYNLDGSPNKEALSNLLTLNRW